MRVQAEVSIYPLRTATLMDSIDLFVRHLRRGGLSVEVGPISSHVSGECRDTFRALGEAFEAAARESDVVAAVKVTNACPESGGTISDARDPSPTPSADDT